MRTRRLHARLAYVVRVDNRASIAYFAAPVRSVRRGVVSPEVLMRSLSSQCHASRIKKYSAFGARHQREDLSAGYAPRQHPATIVENAKALVPNTWKRLIEHDVDTNKPQCSATLWRSSTRPPLARFICRFKANF